MSKILCIVPHYFGQHSEFVGGSTDLDHTRKRRRIVQRTIRQLRRLSAVMPLDIFVFGIRGCNLLPIDVDVASVVQGPEHIMWAAFHSIADRLPGYQHVLVVEDDILVPGYTLRRMLSAQKDLPGDEILFPNRISLIASVPVVVDLTTIPNWTGYSRVWNGQTWHEARNPHSAMLFMSREQIARVLATTDFSTPEIVIGYYMASCLAKAHRDFRLLRQRSWLPTHFVYHQDYSARRRNRRIADILKVHWNGYQKPAT